MEARQVPALFPPVLAHQGGWDEILLVVGPLGVVGLALWLVNKRATARIEEAKSDHDG
jgi:cyanate permease